MPVAKLFSREPQPGTRGGQPIVESKLRRNERPGWLVYVLQNRRSPATRASVGSAPSPLGSLSRNSQTHLVSRNPSPGCPAGPCHCLPTLLPTFPGWSQAPQAGRDCCVTSYPWAQYLHSAQDSQPSSTSSSILSSTSSYHLHGRPPAPQLTSYASQFSPGALLSQFSPNLRHQRGIKTPDSWRSAYSPTHMESIKL